jgi:hypothetical protein
MIGFIKEHCSDDGTMGEASGGWRCRTTQPWHQMPSRRTTLPHASWAAFPLSSEK